MSSIVFKLSGSAVAAAVSSDMPYVFFEEMFGPVIDAEGHRAKASSH